MTDIHALPATGFIRIADLIGNKRKGTPPIIPVSRSTVWNWVKNKQLPAPVRLGGAGSRTVAFKVEDIRAFIEGTWEPKSAM